MLRNTVVFSLLISLFACLGSDDEKRGPQLGAQGVLQFRDHTTQRIWDRLAEGSDLLVSVGAPIALATVGPPEVAMVVDASGPFIRVRGIGPGSARLFVSTGDGRSDDFPLEVVAVDSSRIRIGYDDIRLADQARAAVLPEARPVIAVDLFDERGVVLSGVNGGALSASTAGVVELVPRPDSNYYEVVPTSTGVVDLTAVGGATFELASSGRNDVAALDLRADGFDRGADGTYRGSALGSFRVWVDALDGAGRYVYGDAGEPFEVEVAGGLHLLNESTDPSDPRRTFTVVGEGQGTIRVRAVGLDQSFDFDVNRVR